MRFEDPILKRMEQIDQSWPKSTYMYDEKDGQKRTKTFGRQIDWLFRITFYENDSSCEKFSGRQNSIAIGSGSTSTSTGRRGEISANNVPVDEKSLSRATLTGVAV